MRIASIVHDSIVDGQGIRLAVFVQGCNRNCKGCQNPNTHDPDGGHEESVDFILHILKKDPLVDGITITGGEPFDQALVCAKLAIGAKKLGYNVWTYTGYTYEYLLESNRPDCGLLLANTDVLVDGPFVESLKSYELKFRGSSNQRIIDVKQSFQFKRVVEYKLEDASLSKFQVPD